MTAAVAIGGLSLRDYSRSPSGRGWGSPCASGKITVILAGGARVTVDARLAELVGLIMRANEKQGYRYRPADTGAYNCRYIGGTTIWSWHAWAIAIDENWQTNPYTYPLRTDRPRWEIDRWNRFGFAWGGDYSGRKDAMHNEFMGTPAQAALLTVIARRELGPIISGTPAPAPAPAPSRPVRFTWALPAGHYYGHKNGPNESHGGYNTSERDEVKNIQQWLIFRGCVPGVAASTWLRSTWADGLWEDATSSAMRTWFARYFPGQRYTDRCYKDDYTRLSA